MNEAFDSFCNRNKYKLIVFGSLFIFASVFFSRLRYFPSDVPKDSELVASFYAHRQAFETLRAMAFDDSRKVDYISLDTLSDTPLDRNRQIQYRDLLEQIKLVRNIKSDDHDEVQFPYRGGGLLAIGPSWWKGIIYYSEGRITPDNTGRSLDNVGDRNGTYLKPIEKNWYLIYENYNDN